MHEDTYELISNSADIEVLSLPANVLGYRANRARAPSRWGAKRPAGNNAARARRSALSWAMPPPRRFPSPWSIEERQEFFIVKDANGQRIAYLYFEDEPQRRMSMNRLTRDEAFLLAVNIAKLPSVPRQILKDIPRPPNTASRDD